MFIVIAFLRMSSWYTGTMVTMVHNVTMVH